MPWVHKPHTCVVPSDWRRYKVGSIWKCPLCSRKWEVMTEIHSLLQGSENDKYLRSHPRWYEQRTRGARYREKGEQR